MLADVVRSMTLLAGEVHSLEARIRDVLLIFSPGDFLGGKQIGNRGDVGGHLVEVVIVHAESVTASCSAVVGLRRMSDGIEIGPATD
jgi:hypothetical protein